MKLGRNDICWCGSGKKYKSCHLNIDSKLEEMKLKGYKIPTRRMMRSPEQIEGIRVASKVNTEVLDFITPFVKEGVSTGELDRRIYEYTKSINAIPACLGYEGYPKSVCISINDVVCHGIPDEKTIHQHELAVREIAELTRDSLLDTALRGNGNDLDERADLVLVVVLDLGVEVCKPYSTIGDIGYAINTFAKEQGYSVVREIGGHGVGLDIHEDPYVSHIGQPGKDYVIAPSMTFTIEPMINLGVPDVWQDADDGWTIRTDDGKPSAQWEYTLLMTEHGIEILAK